MAWWILAHAQPFDLDGYQLSISHKLSQACERWTATCLMVKRLRAAQKQPRHFNAAKNIRSSCSLSGGGVQALGEIDEMGLMDKTLQSSLGRNMWVFIKHGIRGTSVAALSILHENL